MCSIHTHCVLSDSSLPDGPADNGLISDIEATQVLRALDALDELEAAAVKLVRAELAVGPALDGLIADPLTEGTRLDLLCLVDTMAVDVLGVFGRGEMLQRLINEAPAGGARDALAEHLSRS